MFNLKTNSEYWKEHAWLVFAISGPVLAIAVVTIFFIFFAGHKGERTIEINGESVYVSVAETESLRELGLGDRQSMADDEGMLFIFPVDGKYPFWMKDMHFAIDMLWLNDDGTIAYIQPDVVPATYPEVFAPPTASGKYVLELVGGYCAEHNVKVGDKVSL